MIQALAKAQRSKLDFPALFAYQYLISEKEQDLPGLDVLQFNRRFIYVGRKLHRAELRDASGRLFGYVLGIAVDDDGLLKGVRTLNSIDASDPRVFDRFHSYLNEVAGRYVCIVTAGTEERVYTDPIAMIGCVINHQAGLVGSSLNLVLDREPELNPLFDHEAVANRGGRYTLFHTYDKHVRRMNGSNYLDLANYTDFRFWPRVDGFERPVSEYPAIYDEIIHRARHSTQEVIRNFSTALPVSGGSDSRLIVGFAGDQMQEVDQCFTHITNYSTRYDNAVAKLITQHVGVEHETHSWRAPPPPPRSRFQRRQQLRSFQTAVGAPVGFPDELAKNVQQLIGDDKVVVRGHVTDLLRALFVPPGSHLNWKSVSWMIKRILPVPMSEFTEDVSETFRPDLLAWLRTLPPAAMESPVDFIFFEVNQNATQGFLFNGFHRNFYMSPYNSRRLIELSLAINVDYRRSGAAVQDLLYRMDPDLCAVPFYKEAGADLAAIDKETNWQDISRARMAHTAERFQNGYAGAAASVAGRV